MNEWFFFFDSSPFFQPPPEEASHAHIVSGLLRDYIQALVMSNLHLEFLTAIVSKSLHVVKRDFRSCSDSKQSSLVAMRDCYITALQDETAIINGNRQIIRRVFVQTPDTPDPISAPVAGWVLVCDVFHCMICAREFGLFLYRYTCVACGNVVCSYCSDSKVCFLTE